MTTLEELFDEASERCEFGFWIERNPPDEIEPDEIELKIDDDVDFRAIVAAIVDRDGRSLFLEAGVDDVSGPFVSVKGLDGSAAPVVLRLMATDTSAFVVLDGQTPVQ